MQTHVHRMITKASCKSLLTPARQCHALILVAQTNVLLHLKNNHGIQCVHMYMCVHRIFAGVLLYHGNYRYASKVISTFSLVTRIAPCKCFQMTWCRTCVWRFLAMPSQRYTFLLLPNNCRWHLDSRAWSICSLDSNISKRNSCTDRTYVLQL